MEDKFDPNPILVNVNKLKPHWKLELIPSGLEFWLEGGKEGKLKVSQLKNLNKWIQNN
jgi:hypothetical protein